MAGHAFLPPSGAGAWRYCPAWATANDRYPQDDTPATLEGTAAHEVLAHLLLGQHPHAIGDHTSNGIEVTCEMVEGAELAAQAIRERCGSAWHLAHVEETLPALPTVFGEDVWGTPDIWQYDPAENILRVIDYKFGHSFVDELHNDQLVQYAGLALLGPVLRSVSINSQALFERTRVELTIIQPRNYEHATIRTWSVSAMSIKPQLDALAAAAKRAKAEPETASSGTHCNHCHGRHECRTLAQVNSGTLDLVDGTFSMARSLGAKSTRLAELVDARERLNAEISGIESHLMVLAQTGTNVPGWRIDHGEGRQVWNIDADMVGAIGDMLGKQFRKPGVLTPAQAVKTGVAFAVIQAYTARKSGEPNLTRCDGTEAARVFFNETE